MCTIEMDEVDELFKNCSIEDDDIVFVNERTGDEIRTNYFRMVILYPELEKIDYKYAEFTALRLNEKILHFLININHKKSFITQAKEQLSLEEQEIAVKIAHQLGMNPLFM